MSRLFYVSGDVSLAKRTLRLYIQVVSKAHEAGGKGADIDTDKRWVETLVQGVRMVCRGASTSMFSVTSASATTNSSGACTGMELRELKEAGEWLIKARTRLDGNDKELVASVDLAEGIWEVVSGIKGLFFLLRKSSETDGSIEQDPRTRPMRLSRSLTSLHHSIEMHPTASGYHHLALALSLPSPSQDLEKAVANAGLAVETDPKEIRHWHLLGLLLAKMENWKAAFNVLGEGEALGEVEERGTIGTSESQGKATIPSQPILPASPTTPDTLPSASTLLQPSLPLHPPPNPSESFEHALQLRMTQVALSEYVDGAEIAVEKWVSVFGWVAGQKGLGDSRCEPPFYFLLITSRLH